MPFRPTLLGAALGALLATVPAFAQSPMVLPSFRDGCNRVWADCARVWNDSIGKACGHAIP